MKVNYKLILAILCVILYAGSIITIIIWAFTVNFYISLYLTIITVIGLFFIILFAKSIDYIAEYINKSKNEKS